MERSAIDIRHHDLSSYCGVSEYAQDAGNIPRDFGICCIYPPLVSDFFEWTPYTSLPYVTFNLALTLNWSRGSGCLDCLQTQQLFDPLMLSVQ